MSLKTFKSFLKCTEAQLLRILTQYLKTKYDKVEATYSYIIAYGDIPIGLVAHLDTVHKMQPVEIFHDQEEDVLWSPQGLGADDRAGVYAIYNLIELGYRPHIIFTTGEESGGRGASVLTAVHEESPFEELKFLIELDRSGFDDCVFYNCDNEDFEKYINSFGFETEVGSFSDISILAPAWKVAAVNLSIGYKKEHTMSEHLYLSALKNTVCRVESILKDKTSIKYEYIPFTPESNKTECSCYYCSARIPVGAGFELPYYIGEPSSFLCSNCYTSFCDISYY